IYLCFRHWRSGPCHTCQGGFQPPSLVHEHGRRQDGRCVRADEMSALLDAFAELRRTWDELVGLHPDIISAGGPLSDEDLALLHERVSAHLVAAVALEDQIEIMRAEKGGV